MRRNAKLVVVGMSLVLGSGAVAACKSNSISATTNNNTDAIGPAGGMLTGSNGEELIIPANALMSTTVFTLGVAQPGATSYPQSPPSGLQFAGDVFEYQPHGTQFASPATVVVPYSTTVSNPVILQAEEGSSSWTTLNVTGTTTVDVGNIQMNALEAAVSTLSYFVVAGAATGSLSTNGDGGETGDASLNECSGRAPTAGAPTGTISNFTGRYTTTSSSVALGTMVDGYATLSSGEFALVFTSYSAACGYAENSDLEIGGTGFGIALPTSAPAVQTYPASALETSSASVPATTSPGFCSASQSAPGIMGTGTGVTITAVDSSHVEGTFDFTPSGGTEISGTFNLPICTSKLDSTQECCLGAN